MLISQYIYGISIDVGDKQRDNNLPKFVGALAALVALATGIMGKVEPFACVERAVLAFVLGSFGSQTWYVLFACQLSSPKVDFNAPIRSVEQQPQQEDKAA